MEPLRQLPESITQVQQSLKPFIKSRQQASRVRRILAAHLSSQVGANDNFVASPPLCLVDAALSGEASSSGVKGTRRDYLRSVRANLKARKDYNDIREDRRHLVAPDKPGAHAFLVQDSKTTLEYFLDVVDYRGKHERLRIVQDYLDMLAQKPAAAANHFDPTIVLKDVKVLPKVPQEVMNSSRRHHESERIDLEEHVAQLEKAVLRAKLLLTKEQNFLAKVKDDRSGVAAASTPASASRMGRLQALGAARNELITWIETELAKTSESPEDSVQVQDGETLEKGGKSHIEAQLQSIQRQYSQYTKIRQTLVLSLTGTRETDIARNGDEEMELFTEDENPANSDPTIDIMYPYLAELRYISNAQKFLLQQKSYLTIAVAKQLKESGQGLDRLADESHLLPTFPIPTNSLHRKGLPTFAEEISYHEKPNSSRRAQAWVFASDSANSASRQAIEMKLEEGIRSTVDARQTLSEKQHLKTV